MTLDFFCFSFWFEWKLTDAAINQFNSSLKLMTWSTNSSSNWVAQHGIDLSYKMGCSSCFSILLFFFVMIFSSVKSDYRCHNCNNDSTYANSSIYSANLNRVMSDLFTNTSLNYPQRRCCFHFLIFIFDFVLCWV